MDEIRGIFDEINKYEEGLNFEFYDQPDKSLDRYVNVKPYKHNRCLLPTNKYINASIVDLPSLPVRYILAQAPKKETLDEFEELLSAYKVKMIVQLGGAKYYSLSSLQSNKCLHLEFRGWPDHGIPCKESFLEFYRSYKEQIENIRQENKRPTILVHCNAGVGRSGTFCAFDIANFKSQKNQNIDIVDIVKTLRRYRTMSVQTPCQLAFLFEITNQIIINKFN